MKTSEILILAAAAGGVFLLLYKFGGSVSKPSATASAALERERNIAYANDWFAGRV